MALGSLGTLTLDLAVRLSEFTDGLTRAEREARDSTGRISDSVRGMRDDIAEDINKISGSMAGMAVGAVAVAGAAMATFAIETAKADVQLGIMAGTANTSLKSFQVLTHAAAGFGVEQEALGAIIADTQEKLGEFSATGGGGAADFMEALQNNTKMTDEQIRELGKTLQSKDGVGAIQYLKDELDALGATSQEQRFIMESLAGDLGNLMPLFANGGVILEEYGVQLEDAGVIKTQEAIDKSRILAAETQAIETRFEGVKTQLVSEMIPALGTLITHFTNGKKEGKGFRTEVGNIGQAIRVASSLVVGLAAGISIIATSFQTVGAQVRMIAQTYVRFSEADGFLAKSQAIAAGLVGVAGVTSVGLSSVTEQYKDTVTTIDKLMSGQQNRLSDLGQVYYDSNTFLQSYNEGLAVNTVEFAANEAAADSSAKAIEARSKALAKAQKVAGEVKLTPNKLALDNAQNYGFANYEAQYGLPQGLMTGIHMQESHGKANATGPSTRYGKAKGGFQLIDATAKRFEVDNAYNMEQATEGAAKYLSWLYKRFDGDLTKTIAAYNTGEGNIDKNPMSLILSDRWARNKKTGIGQTKQYTQNVLAYMKSATTDTSKLVYDTVSKQAQDSQKLQEETLRRQGSIQAKYATEREKLDRDYAANVAEIESLYVEGSIERTELLNRAKTEYEEKRQAKAKSILETYMSDEVKLDYEHNKKIDAINAEFAHDDTTREILIDLQKAAYAEDLANFKFTAEAKVRAQYKTYKSIADSARAGSANALSTGKDSMMQRTLGDEDYQQWRLNQDYVEGFDSVNNDYKNRQTEINAVDERGNEAFPELERYELLEIAKQEHLNKMWALEQEYALKDKTLAEQQSAQKVAIYQGLFAGMTEAASVFFGESSRMHKIAFAAEQAYAVHKALMNVEETYSNTFNSLSAIPLIGPYIAAPGAAVAAGLQVASAGRIQGMTAPSVAGIAHGGLDNVPAEATYLLQKDERVLSPKQNKDLVKFMSEGQKSSTGNITINNNSRAEVSASRNPDGTVTIDMVDKMIEKSFKRIRTANSIESKSIQRGTTARVNRR